MLKAYKPRYVVKRRVLRVRTAKECIKVLIVYRPYKPIAINEIASFTSTDFVDHLSR